MFKLNNIKTLIENEEECLIQTDLQTYLNRLKEIRFNLNNQTVNKILNQLNKRLFCIARLPRDNKYYRAEIVDINDKNEFKVFYVDYGDYSYVTRDEIYPLSEKFVRVLPFQAIKCSLYGIEPLEQTNEALLQQGEKLLEITHDSDNIHHNLTAKICYETTETNLKCFNLEQKTYTIQLFKRLSYLPVECDITHELVTYKLNKLILEEEQRIFVLNEYKKLASPFGAISEKFVVHFIRNYLDEEKQIKYLESLETTAGTMICLDIECMISIGLIQTIAQGFYFIRSLKFDHLFRFVSFLKENFITKNELFLEQFIKFNGLNNLILIIYETNDTKLTHLILDLICECLLFISFKSNLLEENYLKSLWYLLEFIILNKNDKLIIDKLCEILLKLSYDLEDLNKTYSNYLNELIRRIRDKFRLEYVQNDGKFEQMCQIYSDYIKSKLVANETYEEESNVDTVDLPYFEGNLSPANSSDESVQEEFENDLIKLFFNSHFFISSNSTRQISNEKISSFKNK
jgi:hypothetical protein